MSSPVTIVDYDPNWPAMYEEEKHRILETVENKILSIEHIGSTAVPGLESKPIIDIMAGVKDLAEAEDYILKLRAIGYDDITPLPGNPEWYYCLGRGSHSTGYHLHLIKFMSDHWARHLLFRDILRTHPEVARRYSELKRRLAFEVGYDRTAYTEAKTSFIQTVVDRATLKT